MKARMPDNFHKAFQRTRATALWHSIVKVAIDVGILLT